MSFIKTRKTFVFLNLLILLFLVLPAEAKADAFGSFLYKVVGNTVEITGYTGASKAVTIPSSIVGKPVTKIGDRVFYGHTAILSIIMPSSVTALGDETFEGCTSLKTITIPSGVTTIGTDAFSSTGLTHITIPSGVKQIGSYAFANCFGLTSITIPGSVASIESYLFVSCTGLESATISAGTTSIKEFAFSGCTSLKNVVIPYGVTTIGNGTFTDCAKLNNVTLPSSVTVMPSRLFSGCTGLTNITLPSSLKGIDDYAFIECAGLKSIHIPSTVKSFGKGVFYDCTSLTGVNIPSGFTQMGTSVFTGCTSLTDITLPTGITSIPTGTFRGCTSLKNINMPNGVLAINDSAFRDCTSLERITIPASVDNLYTNAFSGCTSLSKAVFLGGLPIIATPVFDNCSPSLKLYYHLNFSSAWSGYTDYPIQEYCFITIDLKDGSSPTRTVADIIKTQENNQEVMHIAAPAIPTRRGYAFYNWYMDKNCTIPWEFSTYVVTGDVDAYATWTILNYTVYFDSRGGSAVSSITAQYNSTISAPPAPTRAGFIFGGWYLEPAGITAWNFATDKVTSDNFLFARWNHNITITVNNPSYGSVIGGGAYADGSDVTLKAIPKAGCRFVKWLEGGVSAASCARYTFTVTKDHTFIAEFAAIETPKITSAASAGYNSVKLVWTAVSDAQGYEVWRATSSSGTYTRVKSIAGATTYTDTGLTTNKVYYYKVRAYCLADVITTYSTLSAYKSAKPVPTAPTITAASASYNSIKVTWNAIAGANGYEVYRATSSTGTYTKIYTATSGAVKSYTNTGLTTNKTYYYKVRAYRLVGSAKAYGAYSAVKSTKPVPAAPTGAVAARLSSTSIKVNWNAVAGATMYEVWQATSSSGTYSLVTTTSSLSWTNTGLTTGQPYYYKVRAYRLVGSTKVYGGFSVVVTAKP